jgi:hypothetical protein
MQCSLNSEEEHMPRWLFSFADGVYGATVISYGLVPGLVGMAVCFLLPLYARWIVALLMLLNTAFAVHDGAHFFPQYLLGCAVYVALSALGLYVRARRRQEGFWSQHPYELLVFALGTVILAFFYEQAPM